MHQFSPGNIYQVLKHNTGVQCADDISVFYRIHAVTVCDNAHYFYDHVDQTLEAIGLGDKVKSTDILDVVDGYKGKGYDLTTDEDLGEFQPYYIILLIF